MIRDIETNLGCFGKFKDLLMFMQEENIIDVNIKNVNGWLGNWELFSNVWFTREQIKQIVEGF